MVYIPTLILVFLPINFATGLFQKDESSETTVRNKYYLYMFMIVCNCKLASFFAKLFKKPLNDYIQGRRNYFNVGTVIFEESQVVICG